MATDELSYRVSLAQQAGLASMQTGITERGSAQWNSMGIMHGYEDDAIEDYTDLGIMKRVSPASLAIRKRLVSSALRKGEPWASKGERHNGRPMEKATREMQNKVPSEQQG